MQRIIDGYFFESQVIPDSWDVRIFETNGHREISARNVVIWHEGGPVCADLPTSGLDSVKLAARDAADAEDKRLSNLKHSAQRAKTMCRRVIKAEAFDELLTLTYRDNQEDRELCKKHFAQWTRRMKKALGDFRYCASFEMQKRGAMHVHVATHKLPKMAQYKGVKVKAWEVGTRIWRDIVGAVQMFGPLQPDVTRPTFTGGLCFVGGKTKNGGDKRRKNMSIAKMAGYVSKYILKDFEDSPGDKHRFQRSLGTVIPKPVLMRFNNLSMTELIQLAFTLDDGDVVVSHRVGEWGDSYWLVTEPDPNFNR